MAALVAALFCRSSRGADLNTFPGRDSSLERTPCQNAPDLTRFILSMLPNAKAPSVRAARRATYTMFFADGLGFGIWAGHIPAFKQKFELSDSSLSIVLLAVAAGSIVSMPLAGQAVRHFGSRHCIAVSVAWFAFCLVCLALAPSLTLFVVAALLFGAAKGGVDVGINAQAVVVEQSYGRPIMSSFQALW